MLKFGSNGIDLVLYDGELGSRLSISKTFSAEFVSHFKSQIEADLKRNNLVLFLENRCDMISSEPLTAYFSSTADKVVVYVYSINGLDLNKGRYKFSPGYVSTESFSLPKEDVFYQHVFPFFEIYKSCDEVCNAYNEFGSYLVDVKKMMSVQTHSVTILKSLTHEFGNKIEFDEIKTKIQTVVNDYSTWCGDLESDVVRLSQIEMKSELKAFLQKDKKFLIDYLLPKDKLNEVVILYRKDIERFNLQFGIMIEGYKSLMESDKISPVVLPSLDAIELFFKECLKKVSDAREVAKASLKMVLEKVKPVQMGESFHLGELSTMYENAKQFVGIDLFKQDLAKMTNMLTSTKQTCDELMNSYIKKLSGVHDALEKVRVYRQLNFRFVNQVSIKFETLKMIHNFHSAYLLTLFEISRRLEYQFMFTKTCNKKSNELNEMIAREKKKREIFSKHIGIYVPQTIFHGLEQDPRGFVLQESIDESEVNLPRISLEDIQRSKLFDDMKRFMPDQDVQLFDQQHLMEETTIDDKMSFSSFGPGETLADALQTLIKFIKSRAHSLGSSFVTTPRLNDSIEFVKKPIDDEMEETTFSVVVGKNLKDSEPELKILDESVTITPLHTKQQPSLTDSASKRQSNTEIALLQALLVEQDNTLDGWERKLSKADEEWNEKFKLQQLENDKLKSELEKYKQYKLKVELSLKTAGEKSDQQTTLLQESQKSNEHLVKEFETLKVANNELKIKCESLEKESVNTLEHHEKAYHSLESALKISREERDSYLAIFNEVSTSKMNLIKSLSLFCQQRGHTDIASSLNQLVIGGQDSVCVVDDNLLNRISKEVFSLKQSIRDGKW